MRFRLGKTSLDLLEEGPQIERLGDPRAGKRWRSDPVDIFAGAAENDAMRAARPGLLEGPEHLAAGHMGHAEVGDDEGKGLFVRQAQPFGAIRGERDVEIQSAK